MITEIKQVREMLGALATALLKLEREVEEQKKRVEPEVSHNLLLQIKDRMLMRICPVCDRPIKGDCGVCEGCKRSIPTCLRAALDTIKRTTW